MWIGPRNDWTWNIQPHSESHLSRTVYAFTPSGARHSDLRPRRILGLFPSRMLHAYPLLRLVITTVSNDLVAPRGRGNFGRGQEERLVKRAGQIAVLKLVYERQAGDS